MMDLKEIVQSISDSNRMTLERYLHQLASKPVYIYGAGCFGRELYRVFQKHGIKVCNFLDRNAIDCPDAAIPIRYPQDCIEKENVQVILGIVLNKRQRESIIQTLRLMGYKNIVDGQSIRAHYVYAKDKVGDSCPRRYYQQELNKIVQADQLFTDVESIATYEMNLRAHLLREYSHCKQTDQDIQYFPSDIPFSKGYSRFIDCGAYIGDTLLQLCKQGKEIDSAVAFEPNNENFTQLSQLYNERMEREMPRAFLIPCGVSGNSELRRFSKAGGSSTITEAGNEAIQCVALDDVLKNFAPTFVKMDIEGAEYDALCGAKNMICKFRPDLAICVYHIIDDFYRIPLLLASWNLGYNFYLRAHSSCCMETVLYATCPKEGA